MCSFAERSFSSRTSLCGERLGAPLLRRHARLHLDAHLLGDGGPSDRRARLRRYRSNVSCVKRAATSLSAKGLATHRSGPALAVFLGHRHRPSGSRFFTSPTGFSISLLTYDSKHSPHV